MEMSNSTQYIAVFVIYFIIFIGFGVYQGRKVKNHQDYAIGGRSIPGWAAALSERATGESSWALLGLPGWAYASGLSCFWTLVGCVVGISFAWIVLAHRIRDMAEGKDATSFVDLISKVHLPMQGYIRTISSIVIVFFFFFYVGAQFLGGGTVFNTLFGIDPNVGMLITMLIIIPYTMYGGFKSVIYTDCIQGILMICALIIAPIVGFMSLSGMEGTFATSLSDALSKAGESYTQLLPGDNAWAMFAGAMGGFAYFFGYLGGTPQLSMRFMAIKDFKNTMTARNIGVAWTILGYLGACSIGWLGIAVWGPTGLEDAESVFPRVMLQFFNPTIACIFIVAAFAALISTADSLLILASTEFSENIVKRHFKSDLSPKGSLMLSRAMTAIMAVIALAATKVVPSNLIYMIIGYVWAGIGSPFSALIMLTIFWKGFSSKGALAIVCVGMPFTIFWVMSGLDAEITSMFMTFVVCVIVGVIVSLMSPDKDKSHMKTAA